MCSSFFSQQNSEPKALQCKVYTSATVSQTKVSLLDSIDISIYSADTIRHFNWQIVHNCAQLVIASLSLQLKHQNQLNPNKSLFLFNQIRSCKRAFETQTLSFQGDRTELIRFCWMRTLLQSSISPTACRELPGTHPGTHTTLTMLMNQCLSGNRTRNFSDVCRMFPGHSNAACGSLSVE